MRETKPDEHSSKPALSSNPNPDPIQLSSSSARSRHIQPAPVPIRSSSGLLQSRAAASGLSTFSNQSTQSPLPSCASLLNAPIPSCDSHQVDRPPYRFRRATDSSIRHDVASPNLSTQSLYSSRRYVNHSADRRLTSRIMRFAISTGSCLKSSIISSLWSVKPTPQLRRPQLNDGQSSYLKRLLNTCSSQLGIRKITLWFILILMFGIFDLWRSGDRKLDNQDWGPTRFRAGHRTGAETRRLQIQMRESPFEILAGLDVLADSKSSSNDPFALTGRWLKPVERSMIPLTNRGHVQSDVTAVLLNWNRLENLIVIVSHLCQYDFFESIIIWNNNPKQILTLKDFSNTQCPKYKLSIFNSPTNNFFFSRFLACLQSRTKYCYFQDDDCIVNLIRTMYFQFKSLQVQQPFNDDEDDHQFSVVVQADPVYSIMYNWEWCFNDKLNKLHTCFAWLGHGSFVTKTAVLEFLSLVSSEQSIASDSIALADNFFTTSLNRQPNVIVVPEIIGLPLSDRGFSDGHSGLERNRVYIQRGVETTSQLLKHGRGLGISSISEKVHRTPSNRVIVRAAERGDRIYLMSNVEPFPGERPDFKNFDHGLAGWEDQLGTTGYHLGRVWPRTRLHNARVDWDRRELETINSSYAAAMDGDRSTSWISPQSAHKDDWVGIGWIDKPIIDAKAQMIKIHFITSAPEIFQVDQVIETLRRSDHPDHYTKDSNLTSSSLSSSSWEKLSNHHGRLDRLQQEEQFNKFECSLIMVDNHDPSQDLNKFDCVLRFQDINSFLILENSVGLRIRKLNDSSQRWSIYEAFVDGI